LYFGDGGTTVGRQLNRIFAIISKINTNRQKPKKERQIQQNLKNSE
jgi:hypothetical protein